MSKSFWGPPSEPSPKLSTTTAIGRARKPRPRCQGPLRGCELFKARDERLRVPLASQGYDSYRSRYTQGSGYRFTLEAWQIGRRSGHFSGRDGWEQEPLVRIAYAQLPEGEKAKDRPVWKAVCDALKAHPI
jgi:hypothetical protein